MLAGDHAAILLGALPPIVHIREETDKAALRWSVERMMQELRDPQPGSALVVQHLAQMLLVQALRAHLAEGARGGVNWLFALADKQMSAAIDAMHADPSRRWTLQDLAERAGMSRSTFALRFKETVGSSPMDYLTRWRMLLAGDRLTSSGDPISVISPALGYESESAFSTAFKRVMGCSPRQYGPSAHRLRHAIDSPQRTRRSRRRADSCASREALDILLRALCVLRGPPLRTTKFGLSNPCPAGPVPAAPLSAFRDGYSPATRSPVSAPSRLRASGS